MENWGEETCELVAQARSAHIQITEVQKDTRRKHTRESKEGIKRISQNRETQVSRLQKSTDCPEQRMTVDHHQGQA